MQRVIDNKMVTVTGGASTPKRKSAPARKRTKG